MRFSSLEFGVFLATVLVAYYLLSPRFRSYLLFAASVVFYASWRVEYIFLILGTLSACYFCIWQMAKKEKQTRVWLIACLVLSLAPLIYFKYSNFLLSNYLYAVNDMFGVGLPKNKLNVILPLGISFYTFQLLSYAIDVYRKKAPLERYPVFLLYVLFFPQLIAGPIVRSHILIPQLKSGSFEADAMQFDEGFTLILFGLFKKVVIADYFAMFIDSYFIDIMTIPEGGWDCILLLYAFSFQIYFDFGGYTDIARGASKMLGIELPINFDFPYASKDVREFWRRWHITLSTWLRDYLYISLGGSRKGKSRLYLNLFITMVLGGLWHGASWTFVLWGIYHGVALMITRLFQELRGADRPDSGRRRFGVIFNAISILLTYNFVCLGWLFFRAPSLGFLRAYLGEICHLHSGYFNSNLPPFFAPLLVCLFVGQWILNSMKDSLALPRYRLVRAFGFSVMIVMIMIFSQKGESFIYFQF